MAIPFYETPRFPPEISYGASGGPMWQTTIATQRGGFYNANQDWANALHRYDVTHALKDPTQDKALLDFFNGVRGRYGQFRYKDWRDYTATLESIGTGDGATTSFQLKKTYGASLSPWVRTIKKPVSGQVRIFVNGVEKFSPADFTVNTTTGVVTMVVAPPGGQSVTWTGEFDVPARFDTDFNAGDIETFNGVTWDGIQIVEVRL